MISVADIYSTDIYSRLNSCQTILQFCKQEVNSKIVARPYFQLLTSFDNLCQTTSGAIYKPCQTLFRVLNFSNLCKCQLLQILPDHSYA